MRVSMFPCFVEAVDVVDTIHSLQKHHTPVYTYLQAAVSAPAVR